MQDKLELLLNQLEFEEKTEFIGGSLDKIIGNHAKTKYTFYITLKTNLHTKTLELFLKKIKEVFTDVNDIEVIFTIQEEDKEKIQEYYKTFIEQKMIEYPLLEMAKENVVYLEENKMIIEVSNKAEQLKLAGIERELLKYLSSSGYKMDKIDYRINEEKSKAVLTEIEKLKETVEVKESPKTEEILKGKEIKGEVTKIADILYEVPSVIVEARIFGIEEKELANFTLFSLKITDETDSMYANVFVKKDSIEELKTIKSRLKVGSWYLLKGKIQNDNFKHELVLSIYDITWIKKEDVSIVDDALVKRIELHAHTMMSQMDGITKLDLGKHTCELVEKTIKMGYRGVAITDHNGCQAFPISFGIIKSHNKNIRKAIQSKIEELEAKISEEKEEAILAQLQNELEAKKQEQKNPPIFKGIYGTELTLVDDTINIVVRPTDEELIHNTYVVFDTETTGFNAGGSDQMIEIGAVKICNGEIVDRFDELIDPKRHIPDKITELTCITDEMVQGKEDEEAVTKKFLEWAGNLPMVAHNAKFDISFIEMAMKKYNLGAFTNTVIDTLELSRALDQNFSRHSLSALVKRYDVPWDEDAHHRADYDAEGTAYVFHKMLKKLEVQRFEKINDLNRLISKEEIHKFGRTYHFNALVLNQKGLKNLFTIISLANTTYLYKTPRILRSKLEELREGLLIGSGCYESEVFTTARSKEGEELTNIINFYDYVEVQPPEVYNHLIQLGDFKSEVELKEHIRKIIHATKEAGKTIVATGDVHHFAREDKIYREIIVNQKVPGGGRHPLAKKDIKNIPSQHFRTTKEMLDDFAFLGEELAYEIVVENTNKIGDMVEEVEVIPDTGGTPFSPRVKSDDETSYLDCPRVVTDLVYNRACQWYGEVLPFSIEERIATELYGDIVLKAIKSNLSSLEGEELERTSFKKLHEVILKGFDSVKEVVKEYLIKEAEEELSEEDVEKKLKKSLGGVIGAGFDPIYLIAQRLVKHSNDEGFLVGSRGSVGSSFVATLMGITEVNPLAAHYRCETCKLSIFDDEEGNPLGSTYSSGFDLPDKMCPHCHTPMIKDGQDMPFATFLGFNADKVPDIDLNFSDLNQASTHAYTKVLFGADNVYRAGTIGTVADKTAYGYVKGYCEEKGIEMRSAEIERLAAGCTGVKRTTGQHPGGIVVIPDYMDCFDFTPFQFPAEDATKDWRTTHFDYHSIEECVLKLDILGHSDPTQLRLIQLQSGTDIMKVPMDDKKTMGIFTSTEALGVTTEQIMCNTGTLGIPEFGTPFTIQLVEDTKPTTFAELVKISGLSHGTDVWLGNAQELIKNNVVPFKETIGCRDDIMVYLMYRGLAPIKSFKIMEFVRKGKASKDPETWKEHKKTMEDANIPDWFIDSCEKIKYMFPKAHAAAYVISAFRIAWYKVHMPVYFYASWYSSKATDVEVESMIAGYDAIKDKVLEIKNKGYEATNKENGQLESLRIALEATARGITFAPIDLYESEATVWKAISDTVVLPPFNAIEGLGDVVANVIVEERKKRAFLSIEDLQRRGRVSQTLIEKMRQMGILDGMDESAQLTLF